MKNIFKIAGITIALIIITFFPVLIFRNDIQFDKVKFTEEWVKRCCSGILIVLVMNYFITKLNSLTKNIETLKKEKKFLININSMIDEIKNGKKIISELTELLTFNLFDLKVDDKNFIANYLQSDHSDQDNKRILSILNKIKE